MTVTGNPDPCRYCGRLYTSRTRWVKGVEKGQPVRIRDTEDHDCPAFPVTVLPPVVGFQVIPTRSDDDLAYSLNRYRRSIR